MGRIGVGRVERGRVSNGQAIVLCKADGTTVGARIGKLYQFEGLGGWSMRGAALGDIVAVTGIPGPEHWGNGLRPRLCGAAALHPYRRTYHIDGIHGQ